uniref:Uncharacterized protein n=1 Tax=Nelumbo nucifera TaxID=4432 RepID=A0A822ZUC7_NELNU|nr:TPA_asm: hypothetical protein HUJ06_018769 [Nelumbo nucifera]
MMDDGFLVSPPNVSIAMESVSCRLYFLIMVGKCKLPKLSKC